MDERRNTSVMTAAECNTGAVCQSQGIPDQSFSPDPPLIQTKSQSWNCGVEKADWRRVSRFYSQSGVEGGLLNQALGMVRHAQSRPDSPTRRILPDNTDLSGDTGLAVQRNDGMHHAWLVLILQSLSLPKFLSVGASARSGLANIKSGRMESPYSSPSLVHAGHHMLWTIGHGCFIFLRMHPFSMQLRVRGGHDLTPSSPPAGAFVGKHLGLCAWQTGEMDIRTPWMSIQNLSFLSSSR
ncbi:hypothetical protein BDV19DRAFT_341314 [Aspergillus venezuelensis]